MHNDNKTLQAYCHYPLVVAEQEHMDSQNDMYRIITINWTFATNHNPDSKIVNYDYVHKNVYLMTLGEFLEWLRDLEEVAEDLFTEWEKELDQYSRADLRRNSTSLLNDTRKRYKQLMTTMHRAERSMEPVLAAFQDQVLVLKHNLNARAIGALRGELDSIERDTANLIAQMQKAIAEANAFIDSMEN